jgi:hypothetical protein
LCSSFIIYWVFIMRLWAVRQNTVFLKDPDRVRWVSFPLGSVLASACVCEVKRTQLQVFSHQPMGRLLEEGTPSDIEAFFSPFGVLALPMDSPVHALWSVWSAFREKGLMGQPLSPWQALTQWGFDAWATAIEKGRLTPDQRALWSSYVSALGTPPPGASEGGTQTAAGSLFAHRERAHQEAQGFFLRMTQHPAVQSQSPFFVYVADSEKSAQKMAKAFWEALEEGVFEGGSVRETVGSQRPVRRSWGRRLGLLALTGMALLGGVWVLSTALEVTPIEGVTPAVSPAPTPSLSEQDPFWDSVSSYRFRPNIVMPTPHIPELNCDAPTPSLLDEALAAPP